jgi:hypothetical protein
VEVKNQATDSGEIEEATNEGELNVQADQDSKAEALANALAKTGINMGLSEKEIEIVTGFAASIASALQLANINLVGSDLVWLIKTILDNEEGNIDFSQVLKEENMTPLPTQSTIEVNQSSEVETTTTADSNTGENETKSDGGSQIITGGATSIANSVAVTNVNLVGSKALFTVINIVGTLVGDIILPNGERISIASLTGGNVKAVTTQTSDIETKSSSISSTGENQIEGEGLIETGDATSVSNSKSFANLVRIGENWGYLIINLFGNWSGTLRNWEEAGSQKQVEYGSSVHEYEKENKQGVGGDLTVVTNQDAKATTSSFADSNTGKNTVDGGGIINTGNAISLANSFSLANFVGIGGSIIFGIFNIFGSWQGDLVVAYPDLEVFIDDGKDEILPGEKNEYQVTVINNGYDNARGVDLNVDFEGEIEGLGSLTFEIDNLNPGETKTFSVVGKVSDTALSNQKVKATATVASDDEEELMTNNSSTDSTLVVIPVLAASGSDEDHRLPDLRITVENNVNDFVYPGDTVIGTITVANQSGFAAHTVSVGGNLYNEHPMPPIPMEWDLGNLKAGERAIIEFEIGLIEELPSGTYHISARAKGHSASGDESFSDEMVSDFNVLSRLIAGAFAPEVLAEMDTISSSGESLGTVDVAKGFDVKEYLPYILPTIIFSYLFTVVGKRKLNGEPILPFILKRRKKDEEEN